MASKAGKGESPGAFPWDLESTRQRPEKITVSIGKTLSDIHHSRILYDPPPRILEIKAKINKWDLITSRWNVRLLLRRCSDNGRILR